MRRIAFASCLLVAAAAAHGAPATNAQPQTVDQLAKRVLFLEAEVTKLWNFTLALQRAIPGQAAMGAIAERKAAELINRYLGPVSGGGKRIPIAEATAGYSLPYFLVGDEKEQATLGKDGLRITVAGRGPAVLGNAVVVVWALPAGDLPLENRLLIHADESVPYVLGVLQTHFTWKGTYLDGRRAAPGSYKLFVRVVVRDAANKSAGSAMRFWGQDYARDPKRYVVAVP